MDGSTISKIALEDAMQQPDQDKLDAFLGRMIGDLGSVTTGAGPEAT
jgi:hypothetical protein